MSATIAALAVRPAQAAAAAAPLFDGMGAFRTDDASPRSALARRYVAQGFVLGWSFNGAEAARSFAGALAHDPRSAAALSGLAWALGPTINADMVDADAPVIDDMLRRLHALGSDTPARWRGLAEALSARHPQPGGTRVDEVAYETHMRALLARHPHDADIATLAAEALMNLHPYDWWRADGRALPWTGEIERRLQRALQIDASHPGANHAWVHLMEASPAPQRARAEAERLRTLVPGSAHLLHMPSHIDMRLGDYAAAVQANERALEADQRYLAQVDAQGAYRVGYVAHNLHFLWAAASMQGAGARAIAAADAAYAAACGPRGETAQRPPGTLQLFQALPLYARVRFGRWASIAFDQLPPDGPQPYARAIWHYARATAFARLGKAAEAQHEQAALLRQADDAALTELRIKGVHDARALVEIARLTLAADLDLAQRRHAPALAGLRRAVAIEDALARDEPHVWLAPTRHALGAALLEARRADAAQAVFEQDLRHYPANGWALAGLAAAQRLQGRIAQSQATEAARRRAWRDADTPAPGARL